MRTRILPRKFFNRPALSVARDLLGKFLVRRIGGKKTAVMITETEAYVGPHDLASHASRLWRGSARAARGRTARTEAMFGEAGRFYVYFTYGMHWMLNAVTGPKGYPAAVLVRGGKWRRENGGWHDMGGPARLTKFLKIGKEFNGKPASRRTGLWFEDRGTNPHTKRGRVLLARLLGAIPRSGVGVKRGPRVGVDYAGKWAKKPYNFRLKP